jgi:hypothetical protein
MTNNQIDPNQEPNQNDLSNEELEQVAGGGGFEDIADAAKDAIKDTVHSVKDVKDLIKDGPFNTKYK